MTWKKAQNPKDEVSGSKIDKICEGLKNCGKNAKLIDFQKLKDLHYVNFATNRRQSGSHFAQGGTILPKLVSLAL